MNDEAARSGDRPLIMGVVNVTPDSFSGDGALDPAAAIANGRELLAAGADILDIGGEATNPRAAQVDLVEEMRRVMPVVEGLARLGAMVSIDTTKAIVARAAIRAGARIVNDVSGGLFDYEMAGTLEEFPDVTYIAGHLRGSNLAEVFAPETRGVRISWHEVANELSDRLAVLSPGLRARTWVDPGIGFGKGGDPETNLGLLRHAGDLGRALGTRVVVGPSRKRFLATLVGTSSRLDIDVATVAACLAGVRHGADVLRVHNVALLRTALAVYIKV